MRPADFAYDALDIVDRIDAHGLCHVGAGLHEKLTAPDRGIEAFDARGVGAAGNKEIGIAPRIERGLDLGQHLLDRDHLLARQIAAAIGKDLIADENAGDAGGLEGAHHLPHIVDAAEAGIGVDIDRHLHRSADARVMVGVVAHIGLAHIGLRQHRADGGIAAGANRLETLRLHDARRERVIGAGHQHEPLARHDRLEFLSRVHLRASFMQLAPPQASNENEETRSPL